MLYLITIGDKNERTIFPRTGIRSRKRLFSSFLSLSLYPFDYMYTLFLISEHRRLEHRDGAGRKSRSFSRPFFSSPRLALVIGRTASTHARTYATHTHAIHVESVTEYTGERRTRLASVDRGALDQQPSRGSGIAATKRERMRPLVFIRVPHYHLARLSLSFAAHPPPQVATNACTRGYTRDLARS